MPVDEPPVPPVPTRDLAEDEPHLPDDAELEALAPDLPPLDTDPMAPMKPVPPGPETPVSPQAEAGPPPDTSLAEVADAVRDGRFPE